MHLSTTSLQARSEQQRCILAQTVKTAGAELAFALKLLL